VWLLALVWVLCAQVVAGAAEVVGFTRLGTPVLLVAGGASPTLIDLDGFAHQTAASAQAGSGFIGTYDSINRPLGVTFDTTNKRLGAHVAALKIVENGVTATWVRRAIAAGNRDLVDSFYFRVTAAPSTASRMFVFDNTQQKPYIQMDTSGHLQAEIGTQGTQTTSGTYADSNWHRVDVHAVTSGTTYTLDWTVDGTAQTQSSRASLTAADMTGLYFGSEQATHTLTVWFQDQVLSATAGDYPIGAHVVLPHYPVSEGTDSLGSTNPIVDESGAQANLYQHVDDWNGGLPDTATYVTFTNTALGDAATHYAEFVFGTPANYVAIWDVVGYVAGFAAGTNADQASTSVKLSDGTNVDFIGQNIDYSGSTTVLGYFKQLLARPSGGWTVSNLTGIKARWGLSGDTNPQPRLSAVMMEYAAPETFALAVGGGAAPAGAVTKQDQKAVVGAVTPAGVVAKQGQKSLGGAETPTGILSLVRIMARSFGGTVAPSGGLVRDVAKSLAGALTPGGTVGKATASGLAGFLTPAGADSLAASKSLAGAATPTGSDSLAVAKSLEGAATPEGALGKAVSKSLAGTLDSLGDLILDFFPGGGNLFIIAVGGAITPIGTLLKSAAKALNGGIQPAGSAAKRASKTLSGNATPSGTPSKLASKAFSGGIQPEGDVTTGFLLRILLGGVVAPVGALARRAAKTLAGHPGAAGSLTKQTSKTMDGDSQPVGSLAKLVGIAFGGGLAPSGALVTLIKAITDVVHRMSPRSRGLGQGTGRRGLNTKGGNRDLKPGGAAHDD
jgi:hypothetical protein